MNKKSVNTLFCLVPTRTRWQQLLRIFMASFCSEEVNFRDTPRYAICVLWKWSIAVINYFSGPTKVAKVGWNYCIVMWTVIEGWAGNHDWTEFYYVWLELDWSECLGQSPLLWLNLISPLPTKITSCGPICMAKMQCSTYIGPPGTQFVSFWV